MLRFENVYGRWKVRVRVVSGRIFNDFMNKCLLNMYLLMSVRII